MTALRLGSRSSALARWQSDFVLRRLRALDPDLHIELVEITTEGDAFPEILMLDTDGTGLFTSALERALLANQIDLAVHSFKDLPIEAPAELRIAAVPERGAVEDVLCSVDHRPLAELPAGSRVGTSSSRRIAQLRALRPDLEWVPMRGNVPTRLARVRPDDLDAVVLARAGIERLGMSSQVSEVFAASVVLPAPAQGALAVEIRASDTALAERLAALDHAPSRRAVESERAVLHALAGGCAVPVGALAVAVESGVQLLAGVFDPDGEGAVRAYAREAEPAASVARVVRTLVQGGAREILARFERAPRTVTESA
jgi:hydroxymethylbilane synthase